MACVDNKLLECIFDPKYIDFLQLAERLEVLSDLFQRFTYLYLLKMKFVDLKLLRKSTALMKLIFLSGFSSTVHTWAWAPFGGDQLPIPTRYKMSVWGGTSPPPRPRVVLCQFGLYPECWNDCGQSWRIWFIDPIVVSENFILKNSYLMKPTYPVC